MEVIFEQSLKMNMFTEGPYSFSEPNVKGMEIGKLSLLVIF